MLRWVREHVRPRRLAVVAHSVGGQILPLADEAPALDAVYLVAAQSGHWRQWDGRHRWRIWLVFHLAVPASVALLGRLPARVLGGGEDLPGGVAREWARWVRDPRYVLSHRADTAARFARMRMPMRQIGFTDDALAPPRTVDAPRGYYRNARVEHRPVTPAEVGARSIGHFGFFRPRFADTLWPDARRFLDAHLRA
ncbi:MAG TPA: hypothetical protein RMH99_09190 [Sandaracinaceae bacterium LLY-WYZ-13_1]|nr:hypothetical protein [Sandaracinaceae bacterium LLY-WYZ-13_1]